MKKELIRMEALEKELIELSQEKIKWLENAPQPSDRPKEAVEIGDGFTKEIKQLQTKCSDLQTQLEIKNEEFVSLSVRMKSTEDEIMDLRDIKNSLEADIKRYKRLLEVGESGVGITPGSSSRKRRRTTYYDSSVVPLDLESALESAVTIDKLLIADECVVVKNWTQTPISLGGYKIKNTSISDSFTFPDGFVLPGRASVNVWSCPQNVGKDKASHLDLFWTMAYIWDKSSRAQLLDPSGKVVSESFKTEP
eukprot:TRINITY_DN4073_c0_g2_i1.p1 TRINITY_DN4073_c0_g2~~TRINITY_DN4073_c0_g2_i1.p1  ORF type:complete len:281 (+),score=67.83 TRINITY_DN4073_c0_g2_i1:91-843(+)